MNHLDWVHQGGQSFLNSLWCSFIQWFDELLESLKVLDIILGLVKRFGNSELDARPLAGCKVKFIFGSVSTFTGASSSSSQDI